MGAAGPGQAQGLWVNTRLVDYNPGTRRLVRTSEVGVLTAFGSLTLAAAAIRVKGLKIGMGFKPSHQLSSVAFTAGPQGMAVPIPPGNQIILNEDPAVTNLLRAVFGPGADPRWVGYRIPGAQIPALGWPAADDRLFFVITLQNFGVQHARDVQLVPVVAVLDDVPNDFKDHYALGVAAFTIGIAQGAIEFDSQALGST